MKVVEVENYDEMSKVAAKTIIEKIKQEQNVVLGLATGGTPVGTYKQLVIDYKEHMTSYKNVHTVNLDEYIGLKETDPTSYAYYMKEHLFNDINIPIVNTHIPSGEAVDTGKECEEYETLIDSLGGVDLQLLGIGENGHIGFNEPGTSFHSKTSVVKLSDTTRKANSIYFNGLEEVPTHAISMGISTILKSKQILLLVSGKRKAEVLYRLLTEDIKEELPASILRKHPNVTIVADFEALSIVNEKQLVLS